MAVNLILFDDDSRDKLLPLTYTRPACDIRIGILTIREKWERYFTTQASYITQDYLAEKFPIVIEDDNLVINGTLLPNEKLVKLFRQLKTNEAVVYNDELLAARLDAKQFQKLIEDEPLSELNGYDTSDDKTIQLIDELWKIYALNGQEIENDFDIITAGRRTELLSNTNKIIGSGRIFVEEGVEAEASVFNTNHGSIYLGKNALIMEGAMIRGGFAMGAHSIVKMGSKIYGPTTLGPHCKVGGEINNSVLFGYSNKGHDGYMGNSVVGEWCNLGADTNTSNLKNNYQDIKLWSYKDKRFLQTGQQFCGLIMADHAKSGISIMFNTGSVVGVASNIFGTGYPRNFIPSFAWGGGKGYTTYRLDKAFETMELVMQRRKLELTDTDRKILEHIFKESAQFRSWE